MGLMSSIAAATAPHPVVKINGPPAPIAQVAAPTRVELAKIAVQPPQAKENSAQIAAELSQSTAARLLVQNAEGIVLDNIPFTNDGAILLDDLPLPEKPDKTEEKVDEAAQKADEPAKAPAPEASEPKDPASPDAGLVLVAKRGYSAGREASVEHKSQDFMLETDKVDQPESQAAQPDDPA